MMHTAIKAVCSVPTTTLVSVTDAVALGQRPVWVSGQEGVGSLVMAGSRSRGKMKALEGVRLPPPSTSVKGQ